MKKARKRGKKKPAYPEQTIGSKLATEARKLANSLTEEQRADYFKQAMGMIYGGRGTKTGVRSRH